MDKHWIIIAAALAVAPGQAEAKETAATSAVGNLSGLISADDYPQEALERGEQGTVQVRLAVNRDGRVARCEVLSSSGSDSIDAKTCEIMIERARFTPAADDKGQPVEGSYTQRITWRMIEDHEDMVLGTAVGGWTNCVMNAVIPGLETSLTAETIAEAAHKVCAPLEAGIEAATKVSKLPEIEFATMMRSIKQSNVEVIRELVKQFRAAQEASGDNKT